MLRIFFAGFSLDDIYVIQYMIEDALEKYDVSDYLRKRLKELLRAISNHLDHIQYDD